MIRGASLAIGSKLKAMYGKRLREADFEDMLHKRSVGELAGYLKNETRFSACLGNVQEATIHRGQLELLLERALFDEVSRLRRYHRGNGIFAFYQAQMQMKLITECVRFLHEGRQETFLENVPGYLLERCGLDFEAMMRARDGKQLACALAHTPYGKPFRRLLAQDGALPPTSVCTAQLGKCCFELALGVIEQGYDGREREAIRKLLLSQVEAANLTAAYRMKRYFSADAAHIREHMIPLYNGLSKRAFAELISTPDVETFEAYLLGTRAGRGMTTQDFSFIEYAVAERRLKLNHRVFSFTTVPEVAFLAFLTMREIELANVLCVVEGVRYQVPSDDIRKLLVML